MQTLKRAFYRLWDSATFTTWGSFLTKLLGIGVLMSLVLNHFDKAEIALWFIFMTIFNLHRLIDLGFTPTFSRVISFALGGATVDELKDFRYNKKLKNNSDSNINISTLCKIIPTMERVYNYLAICLLVIIGIIGTFILIKPISQVDEQDISWISWVIVLIAAFLSIKGNKYNAFLIGMNQIARFRRWEILFSLARSITQISVLLIVGDILSLVIATHIWTLFNVIRNKVLSFKVENGIYLAHRKRSFEYSVFKAVWPSAWRSGIGMGLGYGIVQISGLLYSQVEEAGEVASYLLALRIIDAIVEFSQAPFYSKLPTLAILRSKGDLKEQKRVAKRGMTLSYGSFVLGCITFGVFSDFLLSIIGSNADFVSPTFWGILCLANLFHRYGAMHIQLYSITNHIIWHIADGVSGVIVILVSMLLFDHLGIYAFLIGMTSGYLGFYAWFSAKYSYKAFKLTFWEFDKNAVYSLLAVLIFIVVTIFI